jgi:hypothetical protein
MATVPIDNLLNKRRSPSPQRSRASHSPLNTNHCPSNRNSQELKIDVTPTKQTTAHGSNRNHQRGKAKGETAKFQSKPDLSRGFASPPLTTYHSPVTHFLIERTAIRISHKSRALNRSSLSNRQKKGIF